MALVGELQSLASQGMAAAHLALLLDARAEGAEARMAGASACELVWTGPESIASNSRDTAIVIDDIFSTADRSVLVSSFVVQSGNVVFRALARRLDEKPDLRVRMFLHVARKPNDTREDSELLREFSAGLASQWPGQRRPEIFYDPRTLSADRDIRASWHAKCVLADDKVAFVTSANFTEWAQERNVEAGVLIRNAQFTLQLRRQFDGLVQSKQVRRLPGF
jgi:phosphatidylserine/phosphatidylglycerophosphate/cardiolipin synthase-like enzyme